MRTFAHRPSTLIALAALASACAASQQRAEPPARAAAVAGEDPHEPIEKVLQRRYPGLRIVKLGDGTIAFQIRGSSSYNNRATPPLYILDGSPFKPGPDGAMVGLNPYDIDTVKVLSGAEAGMYGVEGANGVIIITTKRGVKPST